MTRYVLAVVVGLMGAICIAGIVASTSRDLEPLAPISIPSVLQLPLLILLGALIGFALRDLISNAVAFGITCLLGGALYASLLAIPGFNTASYTAARFNKGLTDSLYVVLVGGVFVLIGLGIAFAVNVYVRHVYE